MSTLAVISNPLFIVPAVLGGLTLTNKVLNGKILRPVASALAVQLAVHGLAAGTKGLEACLDGFKQLSESGLHPALWARRQQVKTIAGRIPKTPGEPDVDLPTIASAGLADRLTAVLFPHRSRPEAVAIATTGMTTAELLFDAAAIDPRRLPPRTVQEPRTWVMSLGSVRLQSRLRP